MFKLSIQADDEMRKMIREEVKGAIITLTKEEIAAQVAEGFRRIQGNNLTLEPFIQLQATSIITRKVNETLNPGFGQTAFNIYNTAVSYIKGLVAERVNHNIDAEIRVQLATKDIKDLVKKAVSGMTILGGKV
jgi:hypothetical protein